MTISTHVLDAQRGRPASGVTVDLQRQDGTVVATAETNADGRVTGWGDGLEAGVYRLVFHTVDIAPFFPEVVLTFHYEDPAQHYHVPLLLSPFAYSTYRGS
ncbi:5-hydroxyisourate hydrolase [Lentzea sp. NBRC 105346]|uniref:hydroxyisourate hydrolase n=1 Tax=Lentzea sp. NBRC 105346 TaxID=3032205 RepID=UPI0024A59F80|nr:hydroxyisourate hydrolase [Lentzea sp. NBRC 105346]GLZ33456.1 5-hydroxyisourate hydrolase [Lentzea sp. NBRC 105346]